MTDPSAKKNAFLTEASNLEETKAETKPNTASESENESDEDDYYYADEYPNPYYQTTASAQSITNDVSQTKSKNNPSDKSQDDTTVKEVGEKRAISAVAPKVLDQDEGQVEISSTPAFQCLEEVYCFFCVCKKDFRFISVKYLAFSSCFKTEN